MKTRLYGIVKAWYCKSLSLPFHASHNLYDGIKVVVNAEWKEIELVKPGSLQWNNIMSNNIETFSATLNITTETKLPIKNVFFMIKDANGEKQLIGLGKDYDTKPTIETNDEIGDNAADGCKNTIHITWKNLCGKILVE